VVGNRALYRYEVSVVIYNEFTRHSNEKRKDTSPYSGERSED
jgi:hypothetical protein